jgi:hypothetical protein
MARAYAAKIIIAGISGVYMVDIDILIMPVAILAWLK